MSKPYSEFELSHMLTQDRTWRIREISDLRTVIARSDDIQQKVLLRALVAICYAHWEGYVRFAARKYLEHIALRKLLYSTLSRQFLRNHFLPRLGTLSLTKGSLSERCSLIDDILDGCSQRFSRFNEDLVNTQSNLSYSVFCNICLVCGVPSNQYEDKQGFIDIILLKRRNAIAHGEDTFVGIEDLTSLVNTTIELMRTFGDALENQATLKTYKAVA